MFFSSSLGGLKMSQADRSIQGVSGNTRCKQLVVDFAEFLLPMRWVTGVG
jgi:hypothetical protein